MKILPKILMGLAVLYFSVIGIGFIMGPEWGVAAITLPLTPFIMLDTYFSGKSANTKRLEFRLEHSIPLTTEQGLKVAKRVCNLEHLKKHKNDGSGHKEWAMPFCDLEEEDKVYFYKDCAGCNSASVLDLYTGYVLVRDDNPIASVQIEASNVVRIKRDGHKYDRHVPIIEQLH